MINRKAFWISGVLVALMLAAALWRVTQLADWTQLPHRGASGAPLWLTSSAWLLVAPGAIVVASIALLTMRMGMVDAPGETLRPWKKWGGSYLIAYSAIMASLQAFIIAGTLGLLGPISPVLFFRGIIVVFGLLLIVTSNGLSKLPWLPSRFALVDIDADKGAKSLRFPGVAGCVVRAGRHRYRATAAGHDATRHCLRGDRGRGGVGALPLRAQAQSDPVMNAHG
jgi:hypothetical protein